MSLEQFEYFGDKQPSLVCPPNLQSFQCKIKKKKRERFEEAARYTRSEPWGPISICTSLWFVVGLRRKCNIKHQERKSDETGSVEGWMEMQSQQVASTDHRMLCTKSSKRFLFACVAEDFSRVGGKGQWEAKKGKWDYCVRMTEGKSEISDVKTISRQEMKKSRGKDKKIPDNWNTTARLWDQKKRS